MIIVHIDTTIDAHTLTDCYKDRSPKDIVLINPTKDEVKNALKAFPHERLMGLGHGSSYGLFGAGLGYVIDPTMIDLLKDREMIGIWCHAKDFGRAYGLKGFFTSMFVSNPGEASAYHFNRVDESTTQRENTAFAKKVNNLIKNGVPLSEWIDNLQGYNHNLDFVKFNYENFEYFDGTQKEILEENSDAEDWSGYTFDRDVDDFGGTLFDEDCYETTGKYNMGEYVDRVEFSALDLEDGLDEFQNRMGDDEELEVGNTTLTKEMIAKWKETLAEINQFCRRV